MEFFSLHAISPTDGRYRKVTEALAQYFSEQALIKYRLLVESEYFIALCTLPLPQLEDFPKEKFATLRSWYQKFDTHDARRVKEIEEETNHDVKAVEYFLNEKFQDAGLARFAGFIHFGLTSQDINNTAFPMMLRDAFQNIYEPALKEVITKIEERAEAWKDIPMLAHTHGQPASPTTVGKEMLVFSERLKSQFAGFREIPWAAKFGGATGNLNAHTVSYPDIDWITFSDRFVAQTLGLSRTPVTTQIEPYDHLAAFMHTQMRIHTILTDFARDIWTYISMDYFKQKIRSGEVGSSTMPHKVNPIDFENAEGNLGVANALLGHMAGKLPVSRLQRDLTDSTVLRNSGLPMAYALIAFRSLSKGIDKLILHEDKIRQDLEENWAVVAEAIQTILRREGYPRPYEALKALTRTHQKVTREVLHSFIDQLDIPESIRVEMKQITPHNYTGQSPFSRR